MSWIRTSIAAVVALAAPACITTIHEGDCPDAVYHRLLEGSYTSTVVDRIDVVTPFPHTDQVGKTMVIDLTAGTATFTYQNEGQQIVEVWRMGEITEYDY